MLQKYHFYEDRQCFLSLVINRMFDVGNFFKKKRLNSLGWVTASMSEEKLLLYRQNTRNRVGQILLDDRLNF